MRSACLNWKRSRTGSQRREWRSCEGWWRSWYWWRVMAEVMVVMMMLVLLGVAKMYNPMMIRTVSVPCSQPKVSSSGFFIGSSNETHRNVTLYWKVSCDKSKNLLIVDQSLIARSFVLLLFGLIAFIRLLNRLLNLKASQSANQSVRQPVRLPVLVSTWKCMSVCLPLRMCRPLCQFAYLYQVVLGRLSMWLIILSIIQLSLNAQIGSQHAWKPCSNRWNCRCLLLSSPFQRETLVVLASVTTSESTRRMAKAFLSKSRKKLPSKLF